MIPVIQTLYGAGKGNCLSACIASVLEREIDDIPNFAAYGAEWFHHLYQWCLHHSIGIVVMQGMEPTILPLNCYGIATYEVAGIEDETHAVVVKYRLKEILLSGAYRWEFDIIHDPNPAGLHLCGLKDHFILVRSY